MTPDLIFLQKVKIVHAGDLFNSDDNVVSTSSSSGLAASSSSGLSRGSSKTSGLSTPATDTPENDDGQVVNRASQRRSQVCSLLTLNKRCLSSLHNHFQKFSKREEIFMQEVRILSFHGPD